MRKLTFFVSAICLLMFGLAQLQAQTKNSTPKKVHEWWNDQYPSKEFKSANARKLPLISVSGNKFVTPDGKTILFRGMSISDPDKIESQGHWNKGYFEKAKEWGAKLIRIPVHPIAWRERGTDEYLKMLDQAVEWCSELGIYIVIDWHSIGNLKAGLFQDPMYKTSLSETMEFWRIMAKHYKGCTTVAFYELYNEPTIYNGQLGTASWSEWKKINEDMITLIRAFDTEKVELVAGFDWAYDLTPLQLEPINAERIGYVTHPYPHKRNAPYELKFDENFGFAASRFPIIATEIGLILGDKSVAQNSEYAKMIIPYLEGRGISWLAWVFDPEWDPTMFKSWDNFEPTENGKFFRDAMLKQ
jgi:hypothetical protein